MDWHLLAIAFGTFTALQAIRLGARYFWDELLGIQRAYSYKYTNVPIGMQAVACVVLFAYFLACIYVLLLFARAVAWRFI